MRTRTLIATLAGAAAVLAGAGPAHADSISYLKGGNVWLSTPDGARQVPVTKTGGYSFQSQADDGTLIALKGRRLQRLARDGRVLADFATPVSAAQDPNGSHFSGPFAPQISPDGTKVAYEYYWQYMAYDPTCNGGYGCIRERLESGIAYSRADRLTAWDEPGLGRQSGWMEPSWISDTRTMASDPSVSFGNLQVTTNGLGTENSEVQQWFSDDGSVHLRDGEMSRDHKTMAFVGTGPVSGGTPKDDDQIRVYRMTGEQPALPQICFGFQNPSGHYEGPSFSPDGRHVAFADAGGARTGILVGDVPDQGAGCATPTTGARLVIAGASNPDWGPAGVPAAPVTPSTPATPSTPTTPSVPAKPVSGRATIRLAATKLRMKTVFARGFTVSVRAPKGGKAKVRALLGKKTVGTATKTLRKGATTKVGVRISAKGKKLLRKAGKTVRLRVVIAVSGAKATTLKLTLKR